MSEIYRVFKENEAAIRRIVAKYRPLKEDVEDLLQETFVKCFAAGLDQQINNPKAFILRVAKNVAISEAKRKRHSTTNSFEDLDGIDVYEDKGAVSFEDQINDRRKLSAFARVLAEIPEDQKRALLMRKIDGLKFKQIATRLGVSVSTVEKRVASALLQCNDKLRAQGYNLSESEQETGRSGIEKIYSIPAFRDQSKTNKNEQEL